MNEKIEIYLQEKFQKNGFVSFPLDVITQELNVSKKTIYKEYTNKHSLIDKTLTNLMKQAYNKVITIIAEESPFIDKFYSIFDLVKKNIIVFDDESLMELKRSYPDIWLKVARFRKYEILPLFRLLLSSGIKKGVLYDYPKDLYFNFIFGAVKETTRRDREYTEKHLDLLLRIMLNGALTKKGENF